MVLYFIPLILAMFVSFYNSPIQINTLDNFAKIQYTELVLTLLGGFYPLKRDEEPII